ncbi:Uma2 family endonuclease [Plantactinospora veratri]|uniref:Uma2 family endonuclease n=1 Tax=Plantactinospora veratri TaxID=1436122 RepID=A0ABU7SHD7_9ACTN
MTAAVFEHGGPWTEAEYLALGETRDRVELFDGSLHVTPAPTPRHQHISGEIRSALRPAVRAAGLHVLEAVNVRPQPGRIPIPDLVVTGEIDFDEPVVDGTAVRLVCEISSPSNAATDKVLKMHYHAAARIPWYLLVEQETGTLRLHRLDGSHYVEHAVAKSGESLRLSEPVVAEIRPDDLLPRR